MTGLTQVVSGLIPTSCRVSACNRDGCRVSMQKAPDQRVIVDLDCAKLGLPPATKRCDYLFVGEESQHVWVAPIELKSGGFKARIAVEQLQRGADAVGQWLSETQVFRLLPVLVHGRGVHPHEARELRRARIRLHHRESQVVTIRCGRPLRDALR